jgi:hypothetical protein
VGSTLFNVGEFPVLPWNSIPWSTTDWIFLISGVVAAVAVIGIARYVARQEERRQHDTIEREVQEWVEAIIGDLDSEGRRT